MRPIDRHLGVRDFRTIFGGRATATAGGTGDNTAQALSWVDRITPDFGPLGNAKLVLVFSATLAQGATLTLTAQLRDATSGAGAGAASVGSAMTLGVVATGGTGGTTERGTVEIDMDLLTFREFIGVTLTPDLSAANTDTCTIDAVWVVGGSDRSGITRATAATTIQG